MRSSPLIRLQTILDALKLKNKNKEKDLYPKMASTVIKKNYSFWWIPITIVGSLLGGLKGEHSPITIFCDDPLFFFSPTITNSLKAVST